MEAAILRIIMIIPKIFVIAIKTGIEHFLQVDSSYLKDKFKCK